MELIPSPAELILTHAELIPGPFCSNLVAELILTPAELIPTLAELMATSLS